MGEKSGYKKAGKPLSLFGENNPFQFDNYKLLIKSTNPNIELLEIKKSKDKDDSKILCRLVLQCECGRIFEVDRSNVMRKKKYGFKCSKCANKDKGIKINQNDHENKMNYIKARGYEVLSDKEHISTRDKVLLKDSNGYIGKILYSNFRKGKNITIFSMKYNKEFFIHNANVFCQNNDLETKVIGFADNQNWVNQGIKCQCKCGNIFETSIECLLKKGKTTCNKCATITSKWCRYVDKLLDENGISYEKEVRYKNCKDSYLLPFDYRVENKLIEVDGEQHSDLEHYNFGLSMEDRVRRYNKQKYHENIKESFCKRFGIKLLRVSYKEIQDGSYKNKILQFVGA